MKRKGLGIKQHLSHGDEMGCKWGASRHWWALTWGDRDERVLRSEAPEKVLGSLFWTVMLVGTMLDYRLGYIWAKWCQDLLGFCGEIPESFVQLYRNTWSRVWRRCHNAHLTCLSAPVDSESSCDMKTYASMFQGPSLMLEQNKSWSFSVAIWWLYRTGQRDRVWQTENTANKAPLPSPVPCEPQRL